VKCEIRDDAGDLPAQAQSLLERDPVLHNVMLGLLGHLRSGDGVSDAFVAWVADDSGPVGVALQTPPHRMLLSAMPAGAADALAAELVAAGRAPALPGVAGAVGTAERVARGLAGGRTPALASRQYLYRLASAPHPAPPVPGSAALAGPEDHDLLLDWMHAFHAELRMGEVLTRRDAERTLATRDCWLWRVEGEAGSFLGLTPPSAGVFRIGPVFTPPLHRGRGYAQALVTSACALALDGGARAGMLYAEQTNPTANALYQRVGFEFAATFEHWSLS